MFICIPVCIELISKTRATPEIKIYTHMYFWMPVLGFAMKFWKKIKKVGDVVEKYVFLDENLWNIWRKSSKIKNSENFLSICVSDKTIKYQTWFSTVPDRMVKIFFICHPPLSLYRLHINTKVRFGGFSSQEMRFKRNYKILTWF